MAVTVTPNMNDIGLAESTTNYSTSGPSLSLDSQFFRQGNNSLSCQISSATHYIRYDLGASGVDFTSSGEHLYLWGICTTINKLATKASGGIRVYIEDTSAVVGRFYVDGSDTYEGGWKCWVVDPNATASSGNPSRSAIRYVGLEFNVTSMVTGNNPNIWVDAWRRGTGLTIAGGTTGDRGTLAQAFADDSSVSNAYGVLLKAANAVVARGKLTLGSTTAASYFASKKEILIFENLEFSASTFHGIAFQGYGSGTNEIGFGVESGGVATEGSVLVAEGAKEFTLAVLNDNIDALDIFGTVIRGASTTNFGDGALTLASTPLDVFGSTWEGCGTVSINLTSSSGRIEEARFVAATDNAAVQLRAWPTTAKNNEFLSNTYGIDTPNVGTYALDGVSFSGNTKDVDVTASSGTVTLNVTNGGDAPTYQTAGATVVVNNNVTVRVTVKDSAAGNIQNARVRVTAAETVGTITTGDTILTGLTNASGVLETTTFNYEAAFDPTGLDVNVMARQGTSSPYYKAPENPIPGTIKSGIGLDLLIVLPDDE